MEKINVLEHHGYIGEQTVAGELSQFMTAESYAALANVIKSCDKAANTTNEKNMKISIVVRSNAPFMHIIADAAY